jgi:hypothetical protein
MQYFKTKIFETNFHDQTLQIQNKATVNQLLFASEKILRGSHSREYFWSRKSYCIQACINEEGITRCEPVYHREIEK